MKKFFSFIQDLLVALLFLFVIGSTIGSLYVVNLFYGDYNFCVNKKVLNNNYQSIDSYWRTFEIPMFAKQDLFDESLPSTAALSQFIDTIPIEFWDESENMYFFIVDDVKKKISLLPVYLADDKSYAYNLSGYRLNWSSPSLNWLNIPELDESSVKYNEFNESSVKYNEFNRVSMNLTVRDKLSPDREEYSCIKVDQYSYIRKFISMTIREAFNDEASQNNLDPDSPKE